MNKIKRSFKSILQISNPNSLEIVSISVVFSKKEDFSLLFDRFIGKKGLSTTFGSGPLSYEGFENPSQTIFGGKSRSDFNRFLMVFKGKSSVLQLNSCIQDERLSSIWENSTFSKIESEAIIPLTKEIEENLFKNNLDPVSKETRIKQILSELSNSLTNQSNYRPKSYYYDTKKKLVIGSVSTTQLTIAIELNDEFGYYIAFRTTFHSTPAKNIYMSTLKSNTKSIFSPVAMSITKFLVFVDTHPIMNSIHKLCIVYNDESVLLTKRERSKVSLDSKVFYSKSGLNSILKHITKSSETIGNQYILILEDFSKQFVALSKTNETVKKGVIVMKSHFDSLDLSSSSTIIDKKPIDSPSKKGGNV